MESSEGKSLPSTLYTEEYFLTACEGYDVFLESEGKHLSRRLHDAFAKAEVEAGMRILDIGCGRGEIIRHCMRLGIEAYGIDYAEVAAQMTSKVIQQENNSNEDESSPAGVCRADAKLLPFPSGYFDRILMFDVVEHLYPWELNQALEGISRVLNPDGMLVIHTAPNRWYDDYAYPVVRFGRRLLGQGDKYPKNPRAITPVNEDVHVNEQDIRSLNGTLRNAGFNSKVWLDSPPRTEGEGLLLDSLHWLLFSIPPFRWFFEREVFAVARKS
jgi:cyclopropane fatty-acyl-phospholipid synthase-like methyltransferase